MSNVIEIFSAETSDGDSSSFEFAGGDQAVHVGWSPVSMTIVAYGTWDGATLKIQASPDGGTTKIDITDASFTANGLLNLEVRRGLTYYGNISSAGGSTSLSCKAYQ